MPRGYRVSETLWKTLVGNQVPGCSSAGHVLVSPASLPRLAQSSLKEIGEGEWTTEVSKFGTWEHCQSALCCSLSGFCRGLGFDRTRYKTEQTESEADIIGSIISTVEFQRGYHQVLPKVPPQLVDLMVTNPMRRGQQAARLRSGRVLNRTTWKTTVAERDHAKEEIAELPGKVGDMRCAGNCVEGTVSLRDKS